MKFTAFLIPVAKARARFFVRGGHVRSYTPNKTSNAEGHIRAAFLEAKGQKIAKGVPILLTANIYIPKPASLPKRRVFATSRPDIDNYIKLVMDALNKFAWEDDAQVITLAACKLYGDPPRIEIEIQEATQ